MTEEQARELWAAKLEGNINLEEIEQLKTYLNNHIDLKHELEDTTELWDKLAFIETPIPSSHMDQKFDAMLAGALKQKESGFSNSFSLAHWFESNWKVGFAALAIGLLVGLIVAPKGETKVDQLASEVSDLKKMMVLSLIEKPQAQDRIRAVSMVSEVRKSDAGIVEVLIETMNNDKSINVRLAAIDALVQYGADEEVRRALIATINQQTSPLVIVTLADALVQIRAKDAATEFQKMVDNNKVDMSIKSKLKTTIQTLKEI